MRMPFNGWLLMKSLRMLCSTGMDWLAHSIRRLPTSAKSMFLMSKEMLLATEVAIVSCLCVLVGIRAPVHNFLSGPRSLDVEPWHCHGSRRGGDRVSTLNSSYRAAPTLDFDGVSLCACSRNFAALSVASQVKSGSLRPKCPYAAVFL